jgi:hypothetical protein
LAGLVKQHVQIRKQIARSLKLLAAQPTDCETLISNAGSVGSMLEEEIDQAAMSSRNANGG